MGEALITRRGGGFNLEGIRSYQACSLSFQRTSGQQTIYVTVPETIEIGDIKGFIVSASAVTIFYNKDGEFIWISNPEYSRSYPTTLTINASRQIDNPLPYVGVSGNVIILY